MLFMALRTRKGKLSGKVNWDQHNFNKLKCVMVEWKQTVWGDFFRNQTVTTAWCSFRFWVECFSWFTRVYPKTFGMDSWFIFVPQQNSDDEISWKLLAKSLQASQLIGQFESKIFGGFII